MLGYIYMRSSNVRSFFLMRNIDGKYRSATAPHSFLNLSTVGYLYASFQCLFIGVQSRRRTYQNLQYHYMNFKLV